MINCGMLLWGSERVMEQLALTYFMALSWKMLGWITINHRRISGYPIIWSRLFSIYAGLFSWGESVFSHLLSPFFYLSYTFPSLLKYSSTINFVCPVIIPLIPFSFLPFTLKQVTSIFPKISCYRGITMKNISCATY